MDSRDGPNSGTRHVAGICLTISAATNPFISLDGIAVNLATAAARNASNPRR